MDSKPIRVVSQTIQKGDRIAVEKVKEMMTCSTGVGGAGGTESKAGVALPKGFEPVADEKTLVRSSIDTIRKLREGAERGSEAMKALIELRHFAEDFLKGGPGAFRYPVYAQELMPFMDLDGTALPRVRAAAKDKDGGTVRKYLDDIDNRIGMESVYEYLECWGPNPEDPSPASCADIIHGLVVAMIEWLRRPGHEGLWHAEAAEERRAPVDRIDVFEDRTGGPIMFIVGQAGTALCALSREDYDYFTQSCDESDPYIYDLMTDRNACLGGMMEDCPHAIKFNTYLEFDFSGVTVNCEEYDVHDGYLVCCETCRKIATFSAPGRRDSNLFSADRVDRCLQDPVERIEAIADTSGGISVFALNASGEAILGRYPDDKPCGSLREYLRETIDGGGALDQLKDTYGFSPYQAPEDMAPVTRLAAEAYVNAKAAPMAKLVWTINK